MKTKCERDSFGKHPILVIWDEEDKIKSVIQFGLKKAEAILASVEEIKKFVEENKK